MFCKIKERKFNKKNLKRVSTPHRQKIVQLNSTGCVKGEKHNSPTPSYLVVLGFNLDPVEEPVFDRRCRLTQLWIGEGEEGATTRGAVVSKPISVLFV